MAQQKLKKSKIMRLALFAFLLYVVFSFFIMQLDISKRRSELSELETKRDEELYINQEIQSILDSGTDKEYIMRMAREKLGFVFPDERVFIDPNRKQ